MTELRFEWDGTKASRNLRKHGISFEEAKTAFSDDFALLIPDPDHSHGEPRFLLLGASSGLRVLMVVHCYRSNDEVIRIISARRASGSEQRQYRRRWKT